MCFRINMNTTSTISIQQCTVGFIFLLLTGKNQLLPLLPGAFLFRKRSLTLENTFSWSLSHSAIERPGQGSPNTWSSFSDNLLSIHANKWCRQSNDVIGTCTVGLCKHRNHDTLKIQIGKSSFGGGSQVQQVEGGKKWGGVLGGAVLNWAGAAQMSRGSEDGHAVKFCSFSFFLTPFSPLLSFPSPALPSSPHLCSPVSTPQLSLTSSSSTFSISSSSFAGVRIFVVHLVCQCTDEVPDWKTRICQFSFWAGG